MNNTLIILLLVLASYTHADSGATLRYSEISTKIVFDAYSDTDPDQALRDKLIAQARKLIGTPYRYGGTSRKGFDCSGLVQFVFKAEGFDLPRISADQYAALNSITEPQIGDLLFFGRRGRVQHVGIFIGDGKMLHAPSSGKHVTIDPYTTGYWGNRYLGARSVISTAATNHRQLAKAAQISTTTNHQ